MPDIVIFADEAIPVLDQRQIVGGHVWDRTSVDPEDTRIAKMGIAGKEDH
jgi:hypothetical protein